MTPLRQIAISIVCSVILHFSLHGADMGNTCNCEQRLSFQWNDNDLKLSLVDGAESCLRTNDPCTDCKRRQRLLDEFYQELPNIKPQINSHDYPMPMAATEAETNEDEIKTDDDEMDTNEDSLSDGSENDINAQNREPVSPRLTLQEQEKFHWEDRLLKKRSNIEDHYRDLLKSTKPADQCALRKAQTILGYLDLLARNNLSGTIPAWRCIPCAILDGNMERWAHSSNRTNSPAHICGRCEKTLRGH